MNFFSRGDHMCYYCVVCWLVNLVYSKVTNWSEIIITRPLQEPQNQHGGLHSISFFGRPSKILADSFCIHNCFEIVNIFLRYLVCRQFFWPRFKIRSWSLSTISRVDTSEGIADRATCWILNLFIFFELNIWQAFVTHCTRGFHIGIFFCRNRSFMTAWCSTL